MSVKPISSIMQISPYVGGISKTKAKRNIKLSSNENALGTSPYSIEAYEEAAKTLYRYPDGSHDKLREAISEVYDLEKEQIVCGAGSDEIISLLCFAYAGVGDEVIYTEHGFLMYKISTLAAGATPVVAEESNLKTDSDAILRKVTKNTKIVFIANPNNPTGSYITKDELQYLRNKLPDNVLLVVDGAYAEYCDLDDYSAGQELVRTTNNTVMTRTFSKIYGIPALRLGWAYCPVEVADVLNRVRGPFNVSTPAIEAGVAAIYDRDFTDRSKEHNDNWLFWLDGELSRLGLQPHPSVGNFLLVEFPSKEKANEAYEFLFNRGIIVRKTDNYGLPECLRITVGKEEENKLLIADLEEFLMN